MTISEKSYRIIQWMTGDVGQVGVRHFADNPVYDLVGVLVHSKDKVGKDAGEIAGIAPTGVTATDDIESMVAMDADCVFYTPIIMDVDTVCRLLRSGYAGDILPLTLARVISRIDKITMSEVVDVIKDAPADHIDWLGFGKDKDKFLTEPTILGMGVLFFAQSMYMLADGLGVRIDEVTHAVDAAVATEDIPHVDGAIPRGTVAAQCHTYTAQVDGRPLIVFEALYTTCRPDQLDPPWDFGKTQYRIVIEGDPPTEMILGGVTQPDGMMAHPGYDWTAMGAINAIPDVCDAAPGWLTHLDLGLIRPRGLVRK
jgi:hypothetical protein